MPDYDFYCRACKKHFTATMSVGEHDVKPAPCPACHKTDTVAKELSSVTVHTTRKSASPGW